MSLDTNGKEYFEFIQQRAEKELFAERVEKDVKILKERLRKGRWWHRIFPFIITIRRRDK